MKVFFTLLFVILPTSCAPKPEPVLDHATVVAKNASLRLKNSSTSRTLRVLDTGDKVEVLERQGNWYRVRYGIDIQGWMEESTVLTNDTKGRIQDLVASSKPRAPEHCRGEADGELPARAWTVNSDYSQAGARDEGRNSGTRHTASSRIILIVRCLAQSSSVTC